MMNGPQEVYDKWFGFIPKRGKGLTAFIVIIVAAFLIGFLLRGQGSAPPVDSTVHEQVLEEESKVTIWTCSMHPQIQLPNPGKCPICFMDLIPVITEGEKELGERQLRMTETAVKLASIEVSPAERKFVEADIRMVGNITYDETRVASITAWVPGRLDILYANYTGITVNKGDRMVLMYSPQLLSAQEELIQAKKAVEAMTGSRNRALRSTAGTTLDAAREKLRLYGLTERQIEEIELSGKTTDQLTIFAPIGGVVVEKSAKEGMYMNTGTQIYTIADLTEVWVLFDAYQSDLPWLLIGQHIEFTSPSFPGKTFVGTIEFIDPVLDDRTRTAKVRAAVNNRDGKLKPDMFVSGIAKSRLNKLGKPVDESVTDLSAAPLVIPSSAPLLTGTRAVVYVQLSEREEPTFEGREIELGPKAGDYYVVKSGLHEGELVVTNGAFKIDSELQIRAMPSMMNPEGGVSGAAHQHNHGTDTRQRSPERQNPPGHEEHEGHRKPDEHEVHGKSEEQAEHGKPKELDANEAVKALTPLYETYFRLQMALAGDDLPGAVKYYKEIVKTVKAVDMNLFEGKAHNRWMEISKRIGEHARKGSLSKDIDAARDTFLHLSKSFIEMHDVFGHAGKENYYLTFCPMADSNEGAYWLQKVDTVYNSFYGASMLRCGTLKKELPPK